MQEKTNKYHAECRLLLHKIIHGFRKTKLFAWKIVNSKYYDLNPVQVRRFSYIPGLIEMEHWLKMG